jgi:hypothetical protein
MEFAYEIFETSPESGESQLKNAVQAPLEIPLMAGWQRCLGCCVGIRMCGTDSSCAA